MFKSVIPWRGASYKAEVNQRCGKSIKLSNEIKKIPLINFTLMENLDVNVGIIQTVPEEMTRLCR